MPDDACELLCLDASRAEAVRRVLPPLSTLRQAAQDAKALADPTRLGVALALAEAGEMCVCDLAWVTARQDKLVSHHLKALRTAGLARSRKDGKMVLYSLTRRGADLVGGLMAPATTAQAT